MGNSEKNYFKEIIIGVCITVIGGVILALIIQIFLLDVIYGVLVLIIFILSILIIVLSYLLYTERKEKEMEKDERKKKKPLVFGVAGKDRDEWRQER